jgi:hypothetical protein
MVITGALSPNSQEFSCVRFIFIPTEGEWRWKEISLTSYYGLGMIWDCPPRVHVLTVWFPVWWCEERWNFWEVRPNRRWLGHHCSWKGLVLVSWTELVLMRAGCYKARSPQVSDSFYTWSFPFLLFYHVVTLSRMSSPEVAKDKTALSWTFGLQNHELNKSLYFIKYPALYILL